MDDTSTKYKLGLLKNSLFNLAKSYDDQVKSYPSFVDVFDEVIGDFDNALRLLPPIVEENLILPEVVKLILDCNRLIESNLFEEKTTDYSFQYDDCWNEVRANAKRAIDLSRWQ